MLEKLARKPDVVRDDHESDGNDVEDVKAVIIS